MSRSLFRTAVHNSTIEKKKGPKPISMVKQKLKQQLHRIHELEQHLGEIQQQMHELQQALSSEKKNNVLLKSKLKKCEEESSKMRGRIKQ